MKPQTPEELYADNEDLADEGMLFVGDKGKILCDFRANKPRLIPQEPAAGVRGLGQCDGRRHDDARRRVDQRDQERDEVEGQLRGGRRARRSRHARQHRAARALQAPAVGRRRRAVHQLRRGQPAGAARADRDGWDTLIG